MNEVRACRQGRKIMLEIDYTEKTCELLLEIESDRNKKISDFKEISSYDRDDRLHVIRQDLEGEIWFPVVDVELVPGMYGEAEVDGVLNEETEYAWNGWLWPERKKAESVLRIQEEYLTEWENGCFFNQSGIKLKCFRLFLRIPVFLTISRRAVWEIRLLSDSWSGQITAYFKDQNGTVKRIGSCRVEEEKKEQKQAGNRELTEKNLYRALENNLDYIWNSRIQSSRHPFEGGFYLFYDAQARTYRLPGWLWGWGPAIRLLMECGKMERFDGRFGKGSLLAAAVKAGMVTLKGQVISEDRELNGLGTARWDPNLTMESGYRQRVCGASDSGFLCGWAWCRLYEETGDTAFRDAALAYSASAEYLIDRYKIPPQDYMPEENSWTKHTLDESGFGVEAFEGLYSMTGDKRYRELGRRYIENHLEKFEREDGLWERMYLRESDSAEPCMFMTRGQGWAMEGLLSAWRLTGDIRYREKACRMAKTVVKYQNEDGSWNFIMNEKREKVGTDDKGTPLWSLLLYRLYAADGDSIWLTAARKALGWCLEHQMTEGEEAMKGALVCPTPQSGVVYRPWFSLPCLYTAGFFGLALLEELKLQEESK